jgi:hypothetical protein
MRMTKIHNFSCMSIVGMVDENLNYGNADKIPVAEMR